MPVVVKCWTLWLITFRTVIIRFLPFLQIHSLSAHDNTISTISSNPFTICPCINNVQNCSSSIVNRKAYPGQRFPVSLVAVGQRNGGVSSVIRNKFDEVGATFVDLQDVQPSNNTCTEPHYAVFFF